MDFGQANESKTTRDNTLEKTPSKTGMLFIDALLNANDLNEDPFQDISIYTREELNENSS